MPVVVVAAQLPAAEHLLLAHRHATRPLFCWIGDGLAQPVLQRQVRVAQATVQPRAVVCMAQVTAMRKATASGAVAVYLAGPVQPAGASFQPDRDVLGGELLQVHPGSLELPSTHCAHGIAVQRRPTCRHRAPRGERAVVGRVSG